MAQEIRHGTTTGYHYGCRCEDCHEAIRVYQREYYRRHPRGKKAAPAVAPAPPPAMRRGCPRCGGSVLRQYGEPSCLSCGWEPPVAMPAYVAEEELRLIGTGKKRRRRPSHGKIRLA